VSKPVGSPFGGDPSWDALLINVSIIIESHLRSFVRSEKGPVGEGPLSAIFAPIVPVSTFWLTNIVPMF